MASTTTFECPAPKEKYLELLRDGGDLQGTDKVEIRRLQTRGKASKFLLFSGNSNTRSQHQQSNKIFRFSGQRELKESKPHLEIDRDRESSKKAKLELRQVEMETRRERELELRLRRRRRRRLQSEKRRRRLGGGTSSSLD
ncbi:hypothetical protein CRG98_026933 [Punica granatum]|uniref:Uncharacterized protein n=1 Tax=Punica granatum TaxID=22663 RepID=A0A2I0J9J3_PUNGR|nr:hypothetical protein CRG98_026933 [Punica granatum]